jgi:hypothetical protein
VSDRRATEAETHFSQPVRQIISMLIVVGLVAAGLYVAYGTIASIFLVNPWLNGAILVVFILGVLFCFRQVFQLMTAVSWIERFARHAPGNDLATVPALLAPLATLLRSRGARMQMSSSSARSILDSVAQRVDEDREITRYLSSTLIFLGLLGTFYGLATTVPALVETIRSLNVNDNESGAEIFTRLQAGLEAQLGGMGTAFSSSLLGLAGSLVVGLLELFAGHGQNRFYNELEDWVSTMTRVSLSAEETGGQGETGVMAHVADHLGEQLEALQMLFTQSDIARSQIDQKLDRLTEAITLLAGRSDQGGTVAALTRVADGQDRLLAALERQDRAGDGIDAESRMRLRSIDVQLLRILEEISAGRQETVADLRGEIAGLARALRGTARPGPGQG